MSITTTLERRPHVLFFFITLAILTLSMALHNYDKEAGYSSEGLSEFEQLVRLFLGMLAMLTPQLLFYVVVYWLMYNFKRPTRPKLNVIHFWGLVFAMICQFGMGVDMWYTKINAYPNETSMIEIFAGVVMVGVVLLFLYNVVISLVKPNVVGEGL